MGRWSWSDRNTVEECRRLGIPWLSRYGYFCGFKSGGIEWKNSLGEVTSSIGIEVSVDESLGERYLRLQYTRTSRSREKAEFDYKIDLVTTPCNFGGGRYWFICPLVVNGRACRRRVAKLYLPPGGKYFGCRHCYNLTYRCQKVFPGGELRPLRYGEGHWHKSGGSLRKCPRCGKVGYTQDFPVVRQGAGPPITLKRAGNGE